MPSTPSGITYPSSTGHTRMWEHLETLATTADIAIAKPAIGKASSTSSHTGFGSEVVSLTVSGMVFKSGWAYRAHIRTAVYGTSGIQVLFRLRKTNAAGTNWGEFGRVTCEGVSAGDAAMANGSIVLYRSAGTDLTADVVLTVATDTGTANAFADASSPRYLYIEPIGTATAYSGLGVDVA